jgi:multimeric flavodoxin WrbA
MKSLILNGAFKDDYNMDSIIDVFSGSLRQKGWNVEVIDLNDKIIAGCLSCDVCWFKTPGVCAIDDDGRKVAAKMIQSDMTIFMTPIMFGGYSSELKKFIDRTKPLLSPLMIAKGGVLGHARGIINIRRSSPSASYLHQILKVKSYSLIFSTGILLIILPRPLHLVSCMRDRIRKK